MYARRTPGWVFGHHTEDKFAQLFADWPPARTCPMPREPVPVQLESRSVPTDDCLRLHENQSLLPPRPQPPQHHPEQLVNACEPGSRPPPLIQDSKLLSKSQVFKEKIASRSEEPDNQKRQNLSRRSMRQL
jgi:hypothetical protein